MSGYCKCLKFNSDEKRKLTKKELKEKQIIETRKFNKTMLISFSILFICIMSVLIFYTYWCDTKFAYRKLTLYGNEVPKTRVCMVHNSLQHHESFKVVQNDKTFYVGSHNCYEHLVEYYKEHAFTLDAFSGDTICKANVYIGLKKRGKPELVYFNNKLNLKNYNK